jgi:hypothetical protein
VSTHAILGAESVRFRSRLLDVLDKIEPRRFGYVDEDTSIASCPVCCSALSVHFHGAAARVDLECFGGCSELEVADAVARLTRRAAA